MKIFIAGLSAAFAIPGAFADGVRCEERGKYIAAATQYREESGAKIQVYDNSGGKLKCGQKLGKPIFVWDRGAESDNDQFADLKGKYLMISEGTDVDSGSVKIVDLEKREVLTSVSVPDVVLREDSLLVSYKVRETNLTQGQAENCERKMQSKLDEWRAKEKIDLKIKLKNCECRKWIGEAGNAVAQVQYTISLNDLKETYLPAAGCTFFQ